MTRSDLGAERLMTWQRSWSPGLNEADDLGAQFIE